MYAAEGEVYQAKGTLESLINGKFPLTDIVAEARRKLANLEASGKTDSAADSGSNPSGKTRRTKTPPPDTTTDEPAPATDKATDK